MSSRKFAFFGFSTYIFFYSLLYVSSAQLKIYYVDDLCHGWPEFKFYLRNGISGILTSVPTKAGECTVRLNPESGFSVVLSIQSLNLSPEDQLTITDSDNFSVALLGKAEFSDERVSFSSKGGMVIRYMWNSTEYRENRVKFLFVYTQVHVTPCRHDEFQCRNKNCISKALVCNMHNHCGDNSDQEYCGLSTEYPEVITVNVLKTPSRIAIFVCSIILVIVIIVVIVLVIRRNAGKKKNLGSNNSTPTVTASASPIPLASVEIQAPPSVFARFRQSLRGTKSPATPRPEEPKTEVPSMYPQMTSAPHYPGVENPEFKSDEN